MNQRLIIDLGALPEEGRRIAGELDPGMFDLPEGDARPTGPLCYDLEVRRFGDELLLTGSLAAPFEFTCVRTLHPFVRTVRTAAVPIAVEIGSEQEIDVSALLREEILLQFPIDPRCDDADVPMHCAIDPRYLAVDNLAGHGVENAPPPAGDDRWAALDAWSAPADDPR